MSDWLLDKRTSWSLFVTLAIPLTTTGTRSRGDTPAAKAAARLHLDMLGLNRQLPPESYTCPKGVALSSGPAQFAKGLPN